MKKNYYEANVAILKEKAIEIEAATRDRRWKEERRKRFIASRVGGIIKMKKTTKTAKK